MLVPLLLAAAKSNTQIPNLCYMYSDLTIYFTYELHFFCKTWTPMSYTASALIDHTKPARRWVQGSKPNSAATFLFIYLSDSRIASALRSCWTKRRKGSLHFYLRSQPICYSRFLQCIFIAVVFYVQNWSDCLNMSWAAIENDPGKFIFCCQAVIHCKVVLFLNTFHTCHT